MILWGTKTDRDLLRVEKSPKRYVTSRLQPKAQGHHILYDDNPTISIMKPSCLRPHTLLYVFLSLLLSSNWHTGVDASYTPSGEALASANLHPGIADENPREELDFANAIGCRGGGWIPAGYNPMGYKISALGETFLEFGETCLESDVGRFLASIKTRKTLSTIQSQWLEIVRVSKKGQSMRVYRNLQALIEFCLAARLID